MAWLSGLLQALPFTQAAMLLWGLAAAVPIIIHLLSKRRYQQTTWAAMEFLLAAVRKNARRIRIEQLILLLIRVAILLLLAVALADPVFSLFSTLSSSLATTGRTHYVLVMDASYSMDHQVDGKTRFQRAQEWATRLVNDSRQGDGFTLILMGEPTVPRIADPAFDPNDVIDEIASLRVRHAGASLPGALAEVERVLRQASSQEARFANRRVCFFTDLGKNTWESVTAPENRARIARIAQMAPLSLFDAGQTGERNLAVNSLSLDDWLVTAGRDVAVAAEIENFGRDDEVGCRVIGLLDNQQLHAESLNIPAGETAMFRFGARLDLPGEHVFEVRIVKDPLEVDNHRWLSLPVREAVEVLCIEGRPGSARYLAYALEPERSPRPQIRPTIGLENALLERNLADFDAVFLCNVARLTEDEAGVLAAYVLGGGGLVITVGDLVQAENYNLRLGDATPRVLPARLGAMSEESFYGFDPLQYRHPIIAPFAGHERSGLLTTPIWRSLRAEPYEPDAARVALAYPNGAPAIIEESFGQGRCLLLTTAVSGESIDRSTTPPTPWSALASWPSFPPLVQEMLRYAARRHDQRNVRVGEPLHGRPTDLPGNVVLTVETPLGENERVPLQVDGASSHWEFDHTAWSGVYRAQLGPPVLQEQQFAVNVDTRESDLKPLDREAMPPEFDADLEIDATTDPLPGSRPRQLFRHLLGLVLILLLTESLVAWRLGTASA